MGGEVRETNCNVPSGVRSIGTKLAQSDILMTKVAPGSETDLSAEAHRQLQTNIDQGFRPAERRSDPTLTQQPCRVGRGEDRLTVTDARLTAGIRPSRVFCEGPEAMISLSLCAVGT
jgi:hypothetical protein